MARTRPTTTATEAEPLASVGSDVADPGLAAAGRVRVEWAARFMPVLAMLGEQFAARRPFARLNVAACLNVTPETACLVRLVVAGGARVTLAASNPLSTQDDVAAALAAEAAVSVFARAGVDDAAYARQLLRSLEPGPDLMLDDGGDLINTVHERRPDLLGGIVGACESTVSGVARLRRMADGGELAFPVVGAHTSAVRRIVDHGSGTGQSVLDAVMRSTHMMFSGRCVVVAGFGPVGSGIAERARGMGAQVIVTEVDPVRALEAIMRGFRVLPMIEAAPAGDLFVTATGSPDVITGAHLALMRDGAVLANAGHFDAEIDLAALSAMAVSAGPGARPHAEEYQLADGRRLVMLAEGRVVNLVAAEGSPPAAMDVSFGVQALALAWLAGREPGGGSDPASGHPRPATVLEVPAAIDAEVASLALVAGRSRFDTLTADQRAYQSSWR